MGEDDATRPRLIRFAAVLLRLNIKAALWIDAGFVMAATGEQDGAREQRKTPPERFTPTSAIKTGQSDQKKTKTKSH